MNIVIENCSSPGASFTANTNDVLYSCYEWVSENKGVIKPFIDFRKDVSKAKGFNDNNARNIYPLLKKAGFVKYEAGGQLYYDDFFTNIGLAYAKALETEKLIRNSDYSDTKKEESLKKLNEVKTSLICKGLLNLFSSECNYKEDMQSMLEFLLQYNKISKVEFAYLLFAKKNSSTYISDVSETIAKYREQEIDILVSVDVRNDIDVREKTGNSRRKEGLSFLTAYTYFVALLEQAGLIYKENSKYMHINQSAKGKIQELLEV